MENDALGERLHLKVTSKICPKGADALLAVAWDLFNGKTITSRYIRDRYGVSRPTAFRYLMLLESAIPGLHVEGGTRGVETKLSRRSGSSFIPLMVSAAR